MSRRSANILFAAIFAAFAFLHLYRMGAIGCTWDEGTDLGIVNCLQQTHDPFACLDDISQTRLPYYIHALAHGERAHYLISFFFSALNLVVLYAFARREFGRAAATLAAALYATSPLVLASGRMLLTHSNVIFSSFTPLSFVTLYAYAKTRRFAWLAACAIFSGLTAASSVVALFNGLVIAIFYVVACRPPRWRDLLFFPIAAATFFASTIVYVKPAIFRQLVDACLHLGAYDFWNVFGSGSWRAPWYFPFVVLVVKVGPWWLLLAAAGGQAARGQAGLPVLQRRLIGCFTAAFSIDLLLKGFVFHYEPPHHQVQFYALLYLVIAVSIASRKSAVMTAAVIVAFAIQLYDAKRFFPNYLFYGSQYGERFIGEFYGPAVIHAQDRGPLNLYVDSLIARNPNVRIVVADHNILERSGPNFVVFSQIDPHQRYDYAFVDYLYGRHFHFPERDAYNAWLAKHCVDEWTYDFPPQVTVYRVMRYTR